MTKTYILKIESIITEEDKSNLVFTLINAQSKKKLVPSVSLAEDIFQDIFQH